MGGQVTCYLYKRDKSKENKNCPPPPQTAGSPFKILELIFQDQGLEFRKGFSKKLPSNYKQLQNQEGEED